MNATATVMATGPTALRTLDRLSTQVQAIAALVPVVRRALQFRTTIARPVLAADDPDQAIELLRSHRDAIAILMLLLAQAQAQAQAESPPTEVAREALESLDTVLTESGRHAIRVLLTAMQHEQAVVRAMNRSEIGRSHLDRAWDDGVGNHVVDRIGALLCLGVAAELGRSPRAVHDELAWLAYSSTGRLWTLLDAARSQAHVVDRDLPAFDEHAVWDRLEDEA